jgi:hypothetical protein
MALKTVARQLVLAGGLALAVVAAPTIAGLTGATTPGAYVADSATCAVNQSTGSASLVCAPGATATNGSGGGAPSEGELTAINAQRVHSGGLF